jgi:hypothetical protein
MAEIRLSTSEEIEWGRGGSMLALPFDTDNMTEREERIAALYFECGVLYVAARDAEGAFQTLVHEDNAEMILRIAEATQRTVRTEPTDGPQVQAYFGARGSR